MTKTRDASAHRGIKAENVGVTLERGGGKGQRWKRVLVAESERDGQRGGGEIEGQGCMGKVRVTAKTKKTASKGAPNKGGQAKKGQGG